MYTVYGMSLSGNCYKVKLLLEQLGAEYQWQEVDTRDGSTRTPAFLAMNPAGKVPLLKTSDGRYLPESNAILCYLGDGTPYWQGDGFERASVLQWLFYEQYSHEPYIAVARFICQFLKPDDPRRAELPRLHERGAQALALMDRHLSDREFLVADRYSIADIALFAYTHCAGDGGFELSRYPAIMEWLERVRSQPGFVSMA